MKILFVIDTLICGGAQKILTFVANGLYQRGFKVSVVSYASCDPNFRLCNGIHYIPGTPYKGSTIIKHLRKTSDVLDAIRYEKPNLIVSFAPIPATLSILAAVVAKVPVVFCERGDPYQYGSIISRIKFCIVNYADWFVFQTEAAGDFYPSRVKRRSSIIPNPVTTTYKPLVPIIERKQEIAFVGRFEVKQKRQDLMLAAFAKVLDTHPDMRLVFYGDGDDLDYVKQLASNASVLPYVRFAGNVDNVDEQIRYAKVFVLTSDYEGIPNALIEAMSAGVPCVSTDCSPGGARLLIEDHINGLIVPCGNVEAISNAICYILDNPSESHKMGQNAQCIIERFSPEKILDYWERMINTVCK